MEESTPTKEPESNQRMVVDARYNYACARLGLGMLIYNFEDAVKGDGERIIRCWKFMMLIFRAYNHTKYAFAGLQLQSCLKASLTPCQAHSLTWNRTVNTRGGKARTLQWTSGLSNSINC